MNILAICAHPDDIEVNCAGTLLKYRQQGHNIFIALTTSGNTGSNSIPSKAETAATREKEMLKSAAYLDAQVRFLRFDDEGLQDCPATRRAVLTAIRWADPDIIFTNACSDGSTDHAITAELVTRVILSVGGRHHNADLPPIDKKPQVFFFTSGGNIENCPRAYVDISDVIDIKKKMLYCHESQYLWMQEFVEGDFCDSMLGISRMLGIQAGCKYAEGFVAFNFPGYRGDYRLLP